MSAPTCLALKCRIDRHKISSPFFFTQKIEEELEIEEEYEEEIAMEEEEVTDDVKQVYVDNEDSAQLDSIEAAEENEVTLFT